MSEKAKVDALAVASPVMAAVTALFLAGCIILAHLMLSSGASSKPQLLLKAGLLTFIFGEALALLIGLIAVFRIRRRKDAKGFPEAFLGIFSVCLIGLTAIILLT